MKNYLLYIAVVLFYGILFAEDKDNAVNLVRLNGEITVDGIVDELPWQSVPPFEMTSHWPEFGNPPTDHTEIRVAYDDNYIYVSGIMHADPENILAASFKRDLHTLGTDYLTIVLDTFNDNENALLFATTPTGNRSELAIAQDAGDQDVSWNTFWDAAATQDEKGWYAEMRIPFSSLGFQDINGQVEMGMILYRYTAKKNELVLFPAVEPNWGFWSFAKPSQMQKIRFSGIKSDDPVYLTPYILGGLGQEYDLNADETAYEQTDEVTKNIGLDLKYNVTDNLTLDFSLNTDFAQVEADDQQVNLTRFSLFFPEKRRFFLERASIFDFSFGGPNRLFYTRRIGLNDGEQVDILAGGRLVGRIDDWDVGVLNVQTGRKSDISGEPDKIIPSENFGVVRLRKQVINPYSYVGGIMTSRVDEYGNTNLGYGMDGVFRLFDNDYILVNLAQTYSDTLSTGFDFIESSRMRLLWERRSYNDFSYQFAYEHSGFDYNPVNGFELRENFSRYYNQLAYGWSFKGHPFFQRHQLSVTTDVWERHEDGVLETVEVKPMWNGAFNTGGFFTLGVSAVHEHLNDSYDLSDDVEILAGEYTYNQFIAEYSTPGGEELSADLSSSYGSFFDGVRFSAGIAPKWIASKYLELTGWYEFNHLDFKERNQSMISHLARLRFLITLNTSVSFSAFIQYNSTADLSLINARFRYNPAEGNDLYIVYNEQFNLDRQREIPVLPVSRNRAIIAKYTYTFTF